MVKNTKKTLKIYFIQTIAISNWHFY